MYGVLNLNLLVLAFGSAFEKGVIIVQSYVYSSNCICTCYSTIIIQNGFALDKNLCWNLDRHRIDPTCSHIIWIQDLNFTYTAFLPILLHPSHSCRHLEGHSLSQALQLPTPFTWATCKLKTVSNALRRIFLISSQGWLLSEWPIRCHQ